MLAADSALPSAPAARAYAAPSLPAFVAHGSDRPSLELATNADADSQVERRLVARARSQGALRLVLSLLCARWVGCRGWERLGYASLASHAAERLGRSGRGVRDFARVGRVLAELPRLRAALASGRLGFTKVRLLTRVATPGDEAVWIAWAEGRSAAALSREVRRLDRGSLEQGGFECDQERSRRLELACTPEVMWLWARARQAAQRVHGGLLRVPACVELLVAEALSALPLDPATLEEEPAARALREPEPATDAARGDGRPRVDAGFEVEAEEAEEEEAAPIEVALPAELAALLAGLEELDAFGLEQRLRRAFERERRFEAELGPRLAHVLGRGAYRALGYRTREAYVRERLGLDPSWCRLLLRLERAARISPAFARAYRTGALSALQAAALAALVQAELAERHVRAWVERARHHALPKLRDVVDQALLVRETDWGAWQQGGGLPAAQEGAAAEREIGAKPTLAESGGAGAQSEETGVESHETDERERCRLGLIVEPEVARSLRALLCTVRRRVERETGKLPTRGEAFGIVCVHAIREWGADPATEAKLPRAHRVFARDGWRCTVPGCTAQRNLHAHHIVPRSAGGGNEPANLTTLCAYHHLRGVHAGRVEVTGRAPDRLRVALGLRAGRAPLVVYGPGGRLCRPRAMGRA